MAEVKISELPFGASLNGNEKVAMVQSGTTIQATAQEIADLTASALALKQDRVNGVVSGCVISIGTYGGTGTNNDIRVTAGSWFISPTVYSKGSNTEMYDIELCSAGKLRYIDIVGKNDNTIVILDDTTESEIPVHNAVNIATEVLLGWVLIGDDVIEEPALSVDILTKNFESHDISTTGTFVIDCASADFPVFYLRLETASSTMDFSNYWNIVEGTIIVDVRVVSTTINFTNVGYKYEGGVQITSKVLDLGVYRVTFGYLYGSYYFDFGLNSGGGGSGTSLTDTITAGENLAARDLVYLKSDGKYWKADYTTIATCTTELRLVTATILANATGESLSQGILAGFTGLTAGAEYFVGANGAICLYADIPDTEGIIVRSIGTAKSSTELEFNPDATWIKTTQSPTFQTGIVRLIETRAGVTATLGANAMTDYVENCTGTNTLTLPTAVGNTNKYTVTVISGATTVNTTSAQTINGSGSIVMSTAYLSYDFISNGLNWILR